MKPWNTTKSGKNRKIAGCCIRWCSPVPSASSAVSAWGARLLFTVGRSFYAWIDYSTTKWNRQTRQNQGRTRKSRAAVYVDVRSCFRHLLLFMISYHIPGNIVFKDAPWPCRWGGDSGFPLVSAVYCKTLNCKHDQRIAYRPIAGDEALPHYHQLLV